ncbi:MAG: cytochrome c oxidase subunit II [Gammaproteobacteria bacterium]
MTDLRKAGRSFSADMRSVCRSLGMIAVSVLLFGAPTLSWAAWELNMPRGVTETSQSIFDLHMLIFWICVGIGVIVYGLMFYSLIAYRRRSDQDKPSQFTHNSFLEWFWTLAAAVVLIIMAIPSTQTLIEIYDHSKGDVNIIVTGYQWKWGYEYPDEGFSFISNSRTPQEEISGQVDKGEFYLLDVDNPIYVPINKDVRFLITARDVLHAFWIPDFGIKQDAIPGFFNIAKANIQTPGVYRGVCAELCGLNHGFMPIVVVAVEEDEYRTWVVERQKEQLNRDQATKQAWGLEQLTEQGEEVYLRQCAACHQANGTGITGAFPTLAGSSVVQGKSQDLIALVADGVPGTAMQAFDEILSPAELGSVLTYIRTSWGNGKDLQQPEVQPIEVLNYIEQN